MKETLENALKEIHAGTRYPDDEMRPVINIVEAYTAIEGAGKLVELRFFFSGEGELIIPLKGNPYYAEIQHERVMTHFKEKSPVSVNFVYEKGVTLSIYPGKGVGPGSSIGHDVCDALQVAREAQKS